MDCRNLSGNEEISGTLQAKNQGGHSLNFINPVVYAIEGNGQREPHKGDGWARSDQMYAQGVLIPKDTTNGEMICLHVEDDIN